MKIELNDKQLELMNKALDFYNRLLIGQLHYALEHFDLNDKEFDKLNKKQKDILNKIFSDHDYNEMFNHTENSNTVYDMHQVIRHEIWKKERYRNQISVWSSVTKMGKEDLIKVENDPK
jgi:hypothetical protein